MKKLFFGTFCKLPGPARCLFFLLSVMIFLSPPVSAQVLEEKSFVYDAYGLSIMRFDTEENILFWFHYGSKPLASYKLLFYKSNGAYISTVYTDKGGFCKLPNKEYKEIFVRVNNSRRLHRIKLNRIRKKKYNIFAVYNKNEENIRVQGIISSIQHKAAQVSLELVVQDGKKTVFSGKAQSDKYGFFGINIPAGLLSKDSYRLQCKVEGSVQQLYTLHINKKEHTVYSIQDSASYSVIKPVKTTIFNEESLEFTVENLVNKKIDSLFYTIKDQSGLKDEQIYRDPVTDHLSIKLPWGTGKSRTYTIQFEMIFSDGLSKKEQVVVNRYLDFSGENILKGAFFHKGKLNIYNPYKSQKALLMCYNNDIRYTKTLDLLQGQNSLDIPAAYKQCSFAVIIKDFSSAASVTYIDDRAHKIRSLSALSSKKNNTYTISNVKNMAGKYYFVYFTPLNDRTDPFYTAYHGYNDCLNPYAPNKVLLQGSLQYIDKKQLFLDTPFRQSHALHISQVNQEGEVYNYSTVYLNETIPFVEYLGPVSFSALDKPEQKIVLKNGGQKQDYDLTVNFSDKNIKNMSTSLTLTPYETKEITLNLENASEGELTMGVQLSSHSELVASLKKVLYVSGKKTIRRIVQLYGKILGSRETGAFIKIHDDSPSYTINLHVSTNEAVTAFNTSPLTQNIPNSFFPVELLSYLEKLILDQSFRKDIFPAFLNKYFIKNRGVSRSPYNSEPDLESTILFLLACKNLPLLQGGSGTAYMIKYLAAAYKKEILDNPFYLFVLSEYGYFFKEIDASYISAHKNPLYFYNYFKQYKMTFTANEGKQQSEKSSAATPDMNDLLKLYFNLNNKNDLFASYSLFLYENIMSKLLGIRGNHDEGEKQSVDFVFKSKLLGNFSASLKEEERISKNYQCTLYDFSDSQNKLVDLSFVTESAEDLFYLVETHYSTSSNLPGKNSAYSIRMDLKDHENKSVSKLAFEEGKSYFLHIDIEKQEVSEMLLLQLPTCWGISAGAVKKDGVALEMGKICEKNNFISLDNITDASFQLVLEVQPMAKGTYYVAPAVLYDLSNYDNSVQSEEKYITVE